MEQPKIAKDMQDETMYLLQDFRMIMTMHSLKKVIMMKLYKRVVLRKRRPQ